MQLPGNYHNNITCLHIHHIHIKGNSPFALFYIYYFHFVVPVGCYFIKIQGN